MNINSLSNSIPQSKTTPAQTSNHVATTSTSVQNAYSVKLGTQPIETGTYSNPTKHPMTTRSRAS